MLPPLKFTRTEVHPQDFSQNFLGASCKIATSSRDENFAWSQSPLGPHDCFTWLKPVNVLKSSDGWNQVVIRKQFTTNNRISPKEHASTNTEEQLHELVCWQKISHPLVCAVQILVGSKQEVRACTVQHMCTRPVFPKTVIPTAQGHSVQSSERRVRKTTLSFLRHFEKHPLFYTTVKCWTEIFSGFQSNPEVIMQCLILLAVEWTFKYN